MNEFDHMDSPDLSGGPDFTSQPDSQGGPDSNPPGYGQSPGPQYPGYTPPPGYGQAPGYDPQTGQPYGQPIFQQTINIQNAAPGPTAYYEPKSKIAAGVLGILLGSFGVHNFYLGYTGKAVAQLLITLLTCGIGSVITGVWGLIEGILILTGSIAMDGRGFPLRD